MIPTNIHRSLFQNLSKEDFKCEFYLLIITIQVKIFTCEIGHVIEGEIIKFSSAIKVME